MLNIKDSQPIYATTNFTADITAEQIAGLKTVFENADATIADLVHQSGDPPRIAIYSGDELTVDGSKCNSTTGIGTVSVYFTASDYVTFGQYSMTTKKTFPRSLIHHLDITYYEP